MEAIVVRAHGKINLTLDVLKRRCDGYHEIRSIMQSIALADTVEVGKADAGIDLKVNINFAKPEDNLAYQAAKFFFAAAKIEGGASIRLEKQLPLAAGLAGGSADAAAVLWALNYLHGEPFVLEELQSLGKRLGADVPFCLQGGTQLAEGIGEKLTPLPQIPEYHLVLVKPEQSISTKQVYQALEPKHFGDNYSHRMVQALQHQQDFTDCFGNVMEQVSIAFVPEIKLWRERMLDAGASASFMSGSGPTTVGVFTSLVKAEQFIRNWEHQCWMTVTKPYNHGISVVKE